MFIVIYAAGMPFNGTTIPDGKSLGGSESAAYFMAKELKELGHSVTIFTSHQKGGMFDGVRYEFHGEANQQCPLGINFHTYMTTPVDVLIIQRHPAAFIKAPEFNSKLNIWWLHDLALHRNSQHVQGASTFIDKIFTVSEFHKNQVSEVYGIDKEYIMATHNGVDYEMFKGLEGTEREPNSLVYAARPERGLINLVKPGGIMEKLPDCHLYVCGYDNTTPDMVGMYKYLWGRCEELPNVTNMGALGKRELYRLLAKSMLYVYPTEFEDTSCIMPIEANAVGTPFIASKLAALPETTRGGGAQLLKYKSDEVDCNKFAKVVKSILDDKSRWQELHEKALDKRQDWKSAAIEWDEEFNTLLTKKCENKLRLHRHLEKQSDIVAAIKDGATDDTIPHLSEYYDFYLNDKFPEHYAAFYKHEAEVKKVVYGPQDLRADISQRNRYLATVDALKLATNELKIKNVLDYGCAHGHYTINLAKEFPDINFTGVDIERSNIDIAEKWKADDKVENVNFVNGVYGDIEGEYDLILACEVLEHMKDPSEAVEILMGHLTEGGKMLISVPYGPWEWQGYNAPENIGWRAHLWHFERQDLFEMFGHLPGYRIASIPFMGGTGHYMITFAKSNESDTKVGEINYERKLNQQAPRETLSLCMIAKDAENTLGGCLERFKFIADEIIIGVDRTTTDNTVDICEKYGVQHFMIDSPLEQGFDSARNQTIERAKMDWIFWIDDDELLVNGKHLHMFLRPNCYDGYSIQQHHYSVEPADLVKTDLPVRLFRNHKGIRFYGMVHEHPEIVMNEGLGKVIVLPNIHIKHYSYETEEVRRDRFMRNYPLIKQDRQKYPDRILGKFLWLRDLSHVIRYEMEQNGGVLSPNIGKNAKEIVELWRDLAEQKQTRLVVDALPYYSHATQLMGNGIEYKFANGASRNNGGAKLNEPIGGVFTSTEDIKMLQDMITSDRVSVYDEKYY
jgi:glycosyltransferase involved in cell wall biosynthesis/cyclopropane fatty-acyl-phospholipid synthase-like methyltransferase